ncbi:hypothetical protein PO909_031729, partial [Leuciscus waleckii]
MTLHYLNLSYQTMHVQRTDSSYHQPRMYHPTAQLNLSGQAEPVSTVDQLPMGELSLMQYGAGPATCHVSSVDDGSGVFARQLDAERAYSHSSSPVAQREYHSQSACESLSSGSVSPSLREEEQARAMSPPVVRLKATAAPSIPILYASQSFPAAVVTRDISQRSATWHMTQTTTNATYGATPSYFGASHLSAPHVTLHQQTLSSTPDFRPSYQLTSSLPRTVTSVKLPLVTTAH